MSQQFCLKWNNHMNNMMDVFKNLLSTEAMVDVTLACDGLSLKAHKIVLSACSPFFQSLFLENPCKHPIVILKDMKYTELKAIIEFMYHGEVNVAQDQLSALMKTAETLRVKGLAEVQNEKQSNNTDEPSHRTVPRTDSPPSKRRRGRTRKRSVSDQSDDDVSEPKIKQPDSDIEELSGDMDASSSQYSNVQSSVPMQTTSSHTSNSFHKQSQQQEQPVDQGADESFAQEEKFGVEPSKLLEQTLTTDDLPRRSGRSSVQSNMSDMSVQRRPRSSTDHSSALVPTSMPSDALVVSNQQPESPPDIKPELLELDPPMSPVAGPSHSTDENSMMMYMDQSSMSGMPGPSGYQDNSALVSTDSQPQAIEELNFINEVLVSSESKLHFVSNNMSSKSHITYTGTNMHLANTTNLKEFKCSYCGKIFLRKFLLQQHCRVHTGERPYVCQICKKAFTQPGPLKKHSMIHTGERPFKCHYCAYSSIQVYALKKHIALKHSVGCENKKNV